MNWIFVLFIGIVSSQHIGIKTPIDTKKFDKYFTTSGIVSSKFISLTTPQKRDGLLTTNKEIPTNFKIEGRIKSDGIGKGFALWLTPNKIHQGIVYGGDSQGGINIRVITDGITDVVTLHTPRNKGASCTFKTRVDITNLPFYIGYDSKTKELKVSIGRESGACDMSYTTELKKVYFGISAYDDANGGNHQIRSLDIYDAKKKSKSAKEILGNNNPNSLNYAFTENELFSEGNNMEIAAEKLYRILGKIQDQSMRLDKINDENDSKMKIIISGAKHINEMLKSQELIIDTSDILTDVDTFRDRLNSIDDITKDTKAQIKTLMSNVNTKNENTDNLNKEGNHYIFWGLFFILQGITVIFSIKLLLKKRDDNERKAI